MGDERSLEVPGWEAAPTHQVPQQKDPSRCLNRCHLDDAAVSILPSPLPQLAQLNHPGWAELHTCRPQLHPVRCHPILLSNNVALMIFRRQRRSKSRSSLTSLWLGGPHWLLVLAAVGTSCSTTVVLPTPQLPPW